MKATNFATKDTLPTGDANKIVKGTELDNEFNSLAGAISSKADIASPSFTGTPTAPTATSGSNTTQLATTAFVTTALQTVYPVGSIYLNATNSANPSALLGFGTWTAFGAGRMPVGFNASDSLFDTAEETGGSKDSIVVSHSHTGSITNAGSHSHTYNEPFYNSGAAAYPAQGSTYTQSATTSTAGDHTHTVTINSTGSSGTNANLPPYITVYMWKRTA